LYTAGQFQNLEFTDRIDNIPEELALDTEFIKHLENIMIMRLDAQERKYFNIREKTRGLAYEESITILEDLLAQERAKLNSYLESQQEPQDVI
jgi:hypothetical protein